MQEKEQLLLQMEVLGVPPSSLIGSGERSCLFFHDDNTPQIQHDTKGRRRVPGSSSIASLMGARAVDEQLVSFVEGCVMWEPSKRMTAAEALQHPFIAGNNSSNKSHCGRRETCL